MSHFDRHPVTLPLSEEEAGFTAFLSLDWLGYDILVWSPDFVGSVLFTFL